MKNVVRFTYPRRRFVAGFIAAFTLTIAGCGDKPTVGTSPSGQDTPVVVRVAFFPNITHAAALYGTGTGAFQKAFGNAATIKETVFTAGPAENEALFAGEVDLGYTGPGPAVNGYLKSKGEALQIISGAASGGAALVARKDSGVKTIADLAGKTVAVPQKGGTQDLSLRHSLFVAGLKSSDKPGGTVTVVDFAPADILTQFNRKTVDAAWVPEPWATRLEREAGATVIADERTLWKNGKFSTAVVVVRKAFLAEHPDLVAKFVAAHRAVVAEINAKPDDARVVIGARIKELNSGKALSDDVLKTALSRTEITADPLKDSVLTFADWSREAGYLREDRSALTDLFADLPEAKQTASAKPGGHK